MSTCRYAGQNAGRVAERREKAPLANSQPSQVPGKGRTSVRPAERILAIRSQSVEIGEWV